MTLVQTNTAYVIPANGHVLDGTDSFMCFSLNVLHAGVGAEKPQMQGGHGWRTQLPT